MQPVTLIPVAPEPPPPPKVKAKVPEPKPAPEPVKLNPKQTHVFLTPKAEPPKIRTLEAKPVELNPVFEQVKIEGPKNQPRRPKDEVKVGNLSSGSAATPTVVAPLNKVQTGGFGDPNGIPGKGDPNKTTNVNRLGSPALPGGPGYGNGTGGDKGIHGTVASTGFGNGLGHGLDEAATRAAQQIKFKPAKREGQPVDFPARVRIEFRLAY